MVAFPHIESVKSIADAYLLTANGFLQRTKQQNLGRKFGQ